MKQFIKKYGSSVRGILSGWDRLVFRGHYRILSTIGGMMSYLWRRQILLKDFGQHAKEMTDRLVDSSLAAARRLDRPVQYLPSSAVRKEDLVRDLLRQHPVDQGLICVLRCVEPCLSFDLHRNREAKKLELVVRHRKCLHHYHYVLDPRFGLMYARIQTWFPFAMQIGLNGREWLARQMQADGLDFERYDNCFPEIADFDRAQTLMNEQLRTKWPSALDAIARMVNPAAAEMFGDFAVSYYWTAHQTEWATDIVFDPPSALAAIYPQLVRGAMTSFGGKDVLCFLGRPHNSRFSGEITSDFKDRTEGIRVKHAANGNAVKMYDKGTNILRVETTINNPRDLKVYRAAETDPHGPKQWHSMRKGVADLHRRSELSQKTNERYLEALAQLDASALVGDVLAPVGRPVNKRGRHFRALRVGTTEDQALLAAINRPEFLLGGLRNRDLVHLLYPESDGSLAERRRASARVSYRLRLLRAHGLIAKLPNTRRYRATPKGQQIATTVMTTQTVTVGQLARAAA